MQEGVKKQECELIPWDLGNGIQEGDIYVTKKEVN